MLILGVHGGRTTETDIELFGHAFHDATAVIIRDGQIVAAIEEERLSRIKHTNCFPFRAVEFCLNEARCALSDVDIIATNITENTADIIEERTFLRDSSVPALQSGRACLSNALASRFGCEVENKLRFCPHHIAHAWSVFAPSTYPTSLILTIDGEGDTQSGMVLEGTARGIKALREFSIPQSLGRLYLSLIAFLGFGRFEEYKAMGLAPYGNPNKYGRLFARCYNLLPNGDYQLHDMSRWVACFEQAGLVAAARRKGTPFEQTHMDFAAALQSTVETIAMHVIRHYKRVTGHKNLCVAGGVAQNCSLNGKIAYARLFDRMFVQPAAYDAGTALGAAWWAYYSERPSAVRPEMPNVFLGTDIGSNDQVEARLAQWSNFITFTRCDDLANSVAARLAAGHVIGWVQGRSEFGPRALGNRSILADPRPAENKARINAMIKKREGFRPFAPAVLEERAAEFFELPVNQTRFPFMTVVLNVRPEMRALLGAITHVDGTARVQTVSKQDNPMFWQLLCEFDRCARVPILLNTSFNNNAEPIVDSVDDAVTCFLTTGLDDLVVGDYLVSKRVVTDDDTFCRSLIPEVPPFRKLVRRRTRAGVNDAGFAYEMENTKSADFGPRAISISAEMYHTLLYATRGLTFEEALARAGLRTAQPALAQELRDLWTARAVAMRPAGVHD